jgi:hypothetical protein
MACSLCTNRTSHISSHITWPVVSALTEPTIYHHTLRGLYLSVPPPSTECANEKRLTSGFCHEVCEISAVLGFTQHMVMFPYWYFGTIYQFHLQGSNLLVLLVVPKRWQGITTIHIVISQKSADLIWKTVITVGSLLWHSAKIFVWTLFKMLVLFYVTLLTCDVGSQYRSRLDSWCFGFWNPVIPPLDNSFDILWSLR